MPLGHQQPQQPSSHPHPSTNSPPSPLSRRRISACINELIVLYHSIPTLPTPRRTILSELAVRTLLARNLSIEPNIYGWISPPDACDKVLGDYDHDGNPTNSCDSNCHCSHHAPQHFSNVPCPQYTCYDASKAWQNFCNEVVESSEQQHLPTMEIWNHPPSTPPIAKSISYINPDIPNDCKQETIDKLLSDFSNSIKNPPPEPPTKPPQSTHAPTGVAAFNLSLSITPQGQQFLKNLLKSIIEGME